MTNDNRRMQESARGDSNGNAGGMTARTPRRRAFPRSAAIAALLLSTALTAPATAAIINWDGSASPVWFAPGNWSGGNVPGSEDAAVIDNGNPSVIAADTTFPSSVVVGLSVAGPGASLTIQNFGRLITGSDVVIGSGAGSSGTLTVTGGGSSLSVGDDYLADLTVGSWGSGSFNVLDRAHVTVSGDSYVGRFGDSEGIATVSGVGSQWTTNGSFQIGSVTDEGPAQGQLTISGRGSVSSGDFTVAVGNVTVNTGGTLTTGASVIGFPLGSHGTVLVDGVESSWSATSLSIGGTLGYGTLTISNGGSVTVASAPPNDVVLGSVYLYGSGTLNIGAASGETAVAPGTLAAAAVVFSGASDGIVFNHTATDYVFGAAMSGTAGTIKVESGTNILTGASTYTGATTISSGATLQIGNGGTTGSFAGAIADNGTLVFNRSDALTHGGVISGSGSVTKLGAGNLTLSALGGNGYTGGTTISGGTLTGKISSFGTGDIENNAALVLDAATSSGILANTISGTGGVTKTGAGYVTLTGANTYEGGTTISSGVLKGSATSFGTGDIHIDSIGSLSLEQADAGTLTNAISGAGSISKSGLGNLTLTGDSGAYSGTTYVNQGTLSVNGTLGDSSSTISVIYGTLGGSGTIGGSVIISGGALAPGNSAGTLTINGDLTLMSGSTLNYELGEAGAVGGDYNDHTIVHGNLTLDGTLNVSQSAGGTYGAGIYRLISYDGTLTDNGLELGTMPSGSTNFVQTSVTGQVNLINTQGLELRFWDGDAGPKNNGVINGGSGTWTVAASGAHNDNWTTSDGALNAPFTNGAYAVFQGTAGTVTVNNTAGQVQVSGMQFAVDGYTVTGTGLNGSIELLSGTVDVRVGDGTSDGAAMTATIASVLKGSGKLNKTDLGTLVLTGDNTYSGGTTITARARPTPGTTSRPAGG